ncbi:MAG: hypothetical protein OEV28_12035, partial [Nitrospirota bacterium]|nr:hypothetical protein [Nitrospirota bacterium]
VGRVIAPSSVAGLQVGFEDGKNVVSARVKIRRDQPLSEEQKRWIQQIVVSEFTLPTEVTIETVPFVRPLVFKKGETKLNEEMEQEFSVLKDVYKKEPRTNFALEGRPEAGTVTAKKEMRQRLSAAKSLMVEKLGIPEDRIAVSIRKRETLPTVRVTVTGSAREVRP